MNKLDKIMFYIAPVIFTAAGLMIILAAITSSGSTTRDNNVYVRYIACALSVAPDKRTDTVIEDCWDHVIKEAGREVHRYDDNSYPAHFWLRGETGDSQHNEGE